MSGKAILWVSKIRMYWGTTFCKTISRMAKAKAWDSSTPTAPIRVRVMLSVFAGLCVAIRASERIWGF